MINRRKLLGQLAALPLLGSFFNPAQASAKTSIATPVGRDYFKELGVRTFINAAGTYTSMTGSLLRQEAVDAYNYAAQQYVILDYLQDQ